MLLRTLWLLTTVRWKGQTPRHTLMQIRLFPNSCQPAFVSRLRLWMEREGKQDKIALIRYVHFIPHSCRCSAVCVNTFVCERVWVGEVKSERLCGQIAIWKVAKRNDRCAFTYYKWMTGSSMHAQMRSVGILYKCRFFKSCKHFRLFVFLGFLYRSKIIHIGFILSNHFIMTTRW